MVGAAVDWGNLHVAGAFLLGAVLATIACLRVMRAVTNFFAGTERGLRGRRRRETDDDDPPPPRGDVGH